MKCRLLLFTALFCVLPVFATVSFSNLDLNADSSLIFLAEQEIPGTPSYKSLFLTKLAKTGGGQNQPVLLTCFPEKMELLREKSILQVRNRYGTAWYSVKDGTLRWKTLASQMPVEYTRTGPVAESPDGNWLCYVKQTHYAKGTLVLHHVETGTEHILSHTASFGYEDVPVKWSPDSRILIYEKDGHIYFLTLSSSVKALELPEEFRKIGAGSIQSVQWTKNKSLVYVQGDIVYLISQNELYTRALYSALVGNGTIIGRLPASFDRLHDRFWCSSDGRRLVVLSKRTEARYYECALQGYHYLGVKGTYSLTALTGLSGSLLDAHVFWSEKDEPSLWLDIINYETGKKSSSVYVLKNELTPILDINGSVRPRLSPDGRSVAFTGGASLFVYDIATWKQRAHLLDQKVISFCWATNVSLVVGGEKTVCLWTIQNDSSSARTLFLSGADSAYWDAAKIIAHSGDEHTAYVYDAAKNVWTEYEKESLVVRRHIEKNGHFRVFVGPAQHPLFTNAIFVRALTSPVTTYPLYAESETALPKPPQVSLIFDATDSAEGLARVLSVLADFGIPATFFINGEFIRRYPQETRQIVAAGYECASGFFCNADLLDGTFVIDSAFIKRGLARNEDEFFATTGKELSLLWHAPFYRATALMRRAGQEAGYRYIDALTTYTDRISLDTAQKTGLAYTDSAELIDKLVSHLKDGDIVPINIGTGGLLRTDYLYEKLDLLIAAILNNGYTITYTRNHTE